VFLTVLSNNSRTASIISGAISISVSACDGSGYIRSEDKHMCQQWYSVIGLILDVAGFFLIVREWYWAINLQGGEKVREIGEMGERAARRRRGESESYGKDDQKYMWQAWLAQHNTRRRLFILGAILIIAGFIGQMLGSWPHAFRSC
jgi:hypothetical protein